MSNATFNNHASLVDYLLEKFTPVYPGQAVITIDAKSLGADNSDYCSPQNFDFTVDNADELALLQHICSLMEEGGYSITYMVKSIG